MFFEDFEARKNDMAVFARGLDLYYRGDFSAAAEVFAQTARRDPAAEAYQRKCRELEADPPGGWQGVWLMTSK
jgi:adenylate cyclase